MDRDVLHPYLHALHVLGRFHHLLVVGEGAEGGGQVGNDADAALLGDRLGQVTAVLAVHDDAADFDRGKGKGHLEHLDARKEARQVAGAEAGRHLDGAARRLLGEALEIAELLVREDLDLEAAAGLVLDDSAEHLGVGPVWVFQQVAFGFGVRKFDDRLRQDRISECASRGGGEHRRQGEPSQRIT